MGDWSIGVRAGIFGLSLSEVDGSVGLVLAGSAWKSK